MSIASQLTYLQEDVTNARTAIVNKGGTVTTGGGSYQLATDIATIPTGIAPTGNITINATTEVQTGINVSSYATATVNPTPSESKTVTTNGTVSPSSGKLLSSVIVNVPETPTETKTVSLDMESGDQVINATSGKAMSSVTVTKPATLLPENIKADVVIGGVTGTLTGGGMNYVETTASELRPEWNTIYQWTNNPTSITLNNPTAPENSAGEIVLKFTCGATATSLSIPNTWAWKDHTIVAPQAGYTYEATISYDMKAATYTIILIGY